MLASWRPSRRPPPPTPASPDDRPRSSQRVTAPLSTPHDAVLSELLGLPKISIDGTTSSFYRSERTATPLRLQGCARRPPVQLCTRSVYEPFTGALAGLWAHLSRIRELQSEIAGMHLQMEGIGSSDARSARRAAGATRRATEEWDDPGEAEEQRNAARDAEFATLAETFRGRRAAIDGIMGKLDDYPMP
ncbi:uncharacterized protein B0H18DRAFT_969566 [Fomitopsis serialis]|uniref:uncharacterized protein n=1 Tax=Fomitopsis serialis TaxID=139415 RepID=UPI0020074B91|nr:uncharacterized protein B0H18DRAFT_969566 [Neoantrodia serialis]KAH9937205.1 hypothetical protein B0H18DRAFT_969566 [Neoantrodia serialis]